MVGSSLVRFLRNKNVKLITKERNELDLSNQQDVKIFFKNEKIDEVYLAAAKVGGIYANNTYPANFIYENLMIQNNVIHNAFLNGVKKLLFLGSSCIYPKNANQPIKEEELLNGKLEQTNEPYAIAKISGLIMCASYNRQYGKSHGIDFRSIMPTNLYGPGDNYHPENSHVIPALIYRIHHAKINNLENIVIWGTGTPRRDFLYVDDLAKASIHIMNMDKDIYSSQTSNTCNHINVGSGKDITIKELAEIIKEVIGYDGKILFDKNKPDGTLRKLLDIKKLVKLDFQPEVSLVKGLIKTYKEYLNNISLA